MLDAPPVATGIGIFCIFFFIILLITWCCKKISRTKTPDVTLVQSRGRYVSTIDVQTGLPVVIDVSTLGRGRRGRVAAPRRSPSNPINTPRSGHVGYGSIVQQQPTCPSGDEVLPRTPPPPYSEVPPFQEVYHQDVGAKETQ